VSHLHTYVYVHVLAQSCTHALLLMRAFTRAIRFDLGFTGGPYRFDRQHYELRSQTMGNATMIRTLKEAGLRLFMPRRTVNLTGNLLPVNEYVRAMASTKLWFTSTEHPASGPSPLGDTVTTRYYEIMMSGRSLTLCDRSMQSYEPLGIIDGVHAAMFNTTQEFYEKVMYYTRPEHEGERRRMVASARELALARHTWAHRAVAFEDMLREALISSGPRRRFRGS